jgi:nucleotide-binding universal stress UspA family protein
MRLDDIHVLTSACVMARTFGARLDTLLVRDGHGPPTSASEQPERAHEPDAGREAELLFAELLASTPGSRLTDTVVGGEPRSILERAKASGSDFIVLGSQGLCAVRPERMAGRAEELSRAAPCPVMTVPATTQTLSIRRILLPVDFSTATGRAVEWASTLAQRFSATVHVLHAVGSSALRGAPVRRGESVRPSPDRARAKLDEIEALLRAAKITCESSIAERGTTHAILAGRDLHESDLIVMGVHEHGGDRTALSSMVATIRGRAPVPVLSMTTPDAEGRFALDDPLPAGEGSRPGEAMSAAARRGAGRASWEPSFT